MANRNNIVEKKSNKIELFDVVDRNNKVIYKTDRDNCHKNKLLHRGVAVFLFKNDSYNQILTMRRSKERPQSAGEIITIGGHVRSGEKEGQAALRELGEEAYFPTEVIPVGVRNSLEELFTIEKPKEKCKDYEFIKVYRAIDPNQFSLNPLELEDPIFEDVTKVIANAKEYMKWIESTMERMNIPEIFMDMRATLRQRYVEEYKGEERYLYGFNETTALMLIEYEKWLKTR